jgi:hypothetical protein
MKCIGCSGQLSLWDRIRGSLCVRCRHAKEANIREARTLYQELLGRVAVGGPQASKSLPVLAKAAALAQITPNKLSKLNLNAFRQYAETTLADDILSETEEAELNSIAEGLGITQEILQSQLRDLLRRWMVARINDGRLPVLDDSRLLTKNGEVVHAETEAALMKEVVLRESRGGYSGVSIRIMKGVRYHVGGGRGRSVVVGSELRVADSGQLIISSERSVFIGFRNTLDMPHKKLVSLNVYSDGIQFFLSNRKTTPLFKIGNSDVIAAIVNAAYQRI